MEEFSIDLSELIIFSLGVLDGLYVSISLVLNSALLVTLCYLSIVKNYEKGFYIMVSDYLKDNKRRLSKDTKCRVFR